MLLKKEKVEKTKIIINIEKKVKDDFKSICELNELNMTDVLSFTIKEIIRKGELTSVDYRTEQ